MTVAESSVSHSEVLLESCEPSSAQAAWGSESARKHVIEQHVTVRRKSMCASSLLRRARRSVNGGGDRWIIVGTMAIVHPKITMWQPVVHRGPVSTSGSAARRTVEGNVPHKELTQLYWNLYPECVESTLDLRAARHAALGDPVRLAIVDELALSDRAPVELRRLVGLESNLLAHHLDVLESVGMINRSQSSGDGRRRYVHLLRDSLHDLRPGRGVTPMRALFVCTRNSARSQLAAALWRSIAGAPAESAGTHPADRVDPGALAAAKRAGLDLAGSTPRTLEQVGKIPSLVVTVCDQAHEQLAPHDTWLHWSIPDPVAAGGRRAFDAALAELRERISVLVGESKVAS